MSRTVVVGCKIPNGIRLSDKVTVRGSARDPAEEYDPKNYPGGYRLTPNVPAEVWEDWYKRNQDSTLVENNLIFAEPSEDEARNRARRQARTKSGMEPTRIT